MISTAAAGLEEKINLNILVHLQNGTTPLEDIPKRGLTPYSLVCRAWAEIFRPLLFKKLVLRSANDASQLVAHLNAPQILARPLHAYINSVTIIGALTPFDMFWAYNAADTLYSLFPQTGGTFARPIIEWIIEGASKGGSEEPPAAIEIPTLPPLSAPPSARPILSLTLRDCHLPSISSLVYLVLQTRVHAITLENVTFAHESMVLSPTQGSAERRYALDSIRIQAVGATVAVANLPKFVDLALLSKDQSLLDENTRTVIAGCLGLILLLQQREEVLGLSITSSGREPTTNLNISLDLMNGIQIAHSGRGCASVSEVACTCPDADVPTLYGLLGRLEAAFLGLTDAALPRLRIKCPTADVGRAIMRGVLEDRIFADARMRVGWQFSVRIAGAEYYVADILAAPARVKSPGGDVELSVAQRVEWLLCMSFHSNVKSARRAYLEEICREVEAGKDGRVEGQGVI